jgi:MHS family proline/betaine transporter-like MFS transporter
MVDETPALAANTQPMVGAGCKPADAQRRRVVLAATIGNTLEWYDFLVFSFLSLTIAKLFFPTGDELSSVLLAVGTFGAGLVMRPVGAIVLGIYADRAGRKAALTLTILLMALGTALIAFAPTYQSIGIWAPAIIVISRLLQGFSCGGELGGATAILLESAPVGRRGFYASWQVVSQVAAFVLGSLVNLIVSLSMTPDALQSGGWRLPFVFGLLILPVGLYIRSKLDEPELFLKSRGKGGASPLAEAVRGHRRALLTAFGLAALYSVVPYILLLYMPTFAVRQLGLPFSHALAASLAAGCVWIIACPLMAMVSDRVGRKPLLLASSLLFALLTYPALTLLSVYPNVWTLGMIELAFGLLLVAYAGPAIAALGELFPTRVRSTGVAAPYNLAVATIAGFAQFVVTWLIAATGNPAAPAFYVMGAAIISLAAVVGLKDHFQEPLR